MFSYDKETGILTPSEGIRRYLMGGYIYFRFDDKNWASHRIIWKMETGEDPVEIDHINGVRDDNRWSNLRSVTPSQNSRNKAIRSNNTSGYQGVSWDKKKEFWKAYITIGGKRVHLGSFKNFDDAVSARKAAEQQNNYHPNHGRKAA